MTSGIAHYSRGFAVLFVFFLAGACETQRYREQDIRIILPTAVPSAAATARPTLGRSSARIREGQDGTSKDTPKARWRGIQELLAERKLTVEDLGWIVPDAKNLSQEIAKGNPKVVVSKIEAAQRTIEAWVVNRDFVSGKLERIRALIGKADLTPARGFEMNERLGAVPRLLEEGNYGLANETLTLIRGELAEMSTPTPEPARDAESTPTADGTVPLRSPE